MYYYKNHLPFNLSTAEIILTIKEDNKPTALINKLITSRNPALINSIKNFA